MLLSLVRFLLLAVGFLAIAILVARLVFPPPSRAGQASSTALPPAEDGPLAAALIERGRGQEGKTGIAPLQGGQDAFAARILLANAAVSSIDVQYYIWRADMTGHLLLKALHRAAERGVRVRILLDDNGIDGLDAILAALDAHPNIEIRLFNPFNLRRFKRLSFAFDFFRLNHRMHNKAFTVDGRVSILGGRNVGDEYFETGDIPLQIDLDVLAVGDIVPQISADFDRYWRADPVHPVAPLLGKRGKRENIGSIATRLAAFDRDPKFAEYRAMLESSDLFTSLARGEMTLEWTDVVLVSDDPVINFRPAPRSELFVTRLLEAVGPIRRRFDGVTPYFVPGATGVEALAAMQARGVKVRMLTNSLDATDVIAVHAGYAKRRKDLLRAGIELFELRKEAAPAEAPQRPGTLGALGASGSSLHAKTFAVDGTRVFVGSFNFDPRSMTLNTEMGLLIQSTKMAEDLHGAFDAGLSDLAWRVALEDRAPVWIGTPGEGRTRREPGSTPLRRLALTVVGWLPVEWLL